MGQHRPVQVFNLVTRDSIEERVLRTLEQKRSLLAEIFTGDNDEVAFGALGHQAFLETVRDLVGEEGAAPRRSPPFRDRPPATEDARLKLAQAGVQLLEALAAVMAESTGKNGAAAAGGDAATGDGGAANDFEEPGSAARSFSGAFAPTFQSRRSQEVSFLDGPAYASSPHNGHQSSR